MTKIKNPSNSQGLCIFKDQSDSCLHNSLSKEHLWPVWMSAILPQGNVGKDHSHIKTRILNNQSGILSVTPQMSVHRGPINTRKLRIVCSNCNGGWMSKIESKAKGILGDLIQGKLTSISEDQQIDVCNWMVLKSIIGEYTDLPLMAISESEKMYFKKNISVPPNWNIWIGQFLGSAPGWHQKYSHSGAMIYRPGLGEAVPTSPNFQTTTFVMGELFMHASSSANSVIVPWMPCPELVQIWPPSGNNIVWPPKLPLGDDKAQKIAYRLQNSSISSPDCNAVYFQLDPDNYHRLKESTSMKGAIFI